MENIHENGTFQLHNKVEIPQVGFGTWQMPDGETAADAVMHAIGGRIHPYRYGGGISQRDWGGSRNPHVGSAERKAVCDQQAVERCERL